MTHTQNGKVALVTGGGQGIGQAISERLHADGWTAQSFIDTHRPLCA